MGAYVSSLREHHPHKTMYHTLVLKVSNAVQVALYTALVKGDRILLARTLGAWLNATATHLVA